MFLHKFDILNRNLNGLFQKLLPVVTKLCALTKLGDLTVSKLLHQTTKKNFYREFPGVRVVGHVSSKLEPSKNNWETKKNANKLRSETENESCVTCRLNMWELTTLPPKHPPHVWCPLSLESLASTTLLSRKTTTLGTVV